MSEKKTKKDNSVFKSEDELLAAINRYIDKQEKEEDCEIILRTFMQLRHTELFSYDYAKVASRCRSYIRAYIDRISKFEAEFTFRDSTASVTTKQRFVYIARANSICESTDYHVMRQGIYYMPTFQPDFHPTIYG